MSWDCELESDSLGEVLVAVSETCDAAAFTHQKGLL